MDPGDLLTRWTIRIAMALYMASIVLRLHADERPSYLTAARLSWAVGCAWFFAHAACAFHFFHAWSHADAYAETARKTFDAVGLAWGGGLYVNYAFALVWAADASWWMVGPRSYLSRPKWVEVVVHGFMAFIAFNATVVFGAGAIRWAGIVATILLSAVLLAAFRRRPTDG